VSCAARCYVCVSEEELDTAAGLSHLVTQPAGHQTLPSVGSACSSSQRPRFDNVSRSLPHLPRSVVGPLARVRNRWRRGGGGPGPHSSGTWPAPLRCGLRPSGAATSSSPAGCSRGWQPARGYLGAGRGGAAGCPVAAAARRGVFNSGWGFQLPHASHGQYVRPLRRRPCARWSLLSRGACGGGSRSIPAQGSFVGSRGQDGSRTTQRTDGDGGGRRRFRSIDRCLSALRGWNLEESTTSTLNSAHAISGETDVALRIHLEDRVYTTRSPIDGFPATTSTSIFLLRSAALRWRWALVTLNFLLRGSLSCRSDADPVCIHIDQLQQTPSPYP
jgi:hypothetical protein